LAVAAITATPVHSGLVTAYPSEYLLVRYYANGAIAARTRSVATTVPWFWGTAVYPPNAVLRALPQPSPDTATVWYVYEPGEPLPPGSGGYRLSNTRCWTGVCVTMLNPVVAVADGG
jgi:hypothetical protein